MVLKNNPKFHDQRDLWIYSEESLRQAGCEMVPQDNGSFQPVNNDRIYDGGLNIGWQTLNKLINFDPVQEIAFGWDPLTLKT